MSAPAPPRTGAGLTRAPARSIAVPAVRLSVMTPEERLAAVPRDLEARRACPEGIGPVSLLRRALRVVAEPPEAARTSAGASPAGARGA